MKTAWIILGMTCGVAFSLQAETWRISAQAQQRTGMKATLSGSTYAHEQAASYLPGRAGRSGYDWDRADRLPGTSVDLPGDDIGTVVDRDYDDGFVYSSAINEGDSPEPFTWNWGYEDAGQYDAANGELTFTRSTSLASQGSFTDTAEGRESERSSRVLMDREFQGEADFDARGFTLEASRVIKACTNGYLELVVGVGLLQGDDVSMADETYQARAEQRNYRTYAEERYEQSMSANYVETYVYNDPFGAVAATTPPYAGSYEGPGAVIDILPSSRDVQQAGGTVNSLTLVDRSSGRSLTSVDVWEIHNAVSVDMETDITSVNTGLRGGLKVQNWARLFVQAQAAMNYVEVSLDRRETLYLSKNGGAATTVASWRDQVDDEAWVPSLGLQAGLDILLGYSWYLTGSAGYDFFLDEPDFDVGPSNVKLALDSFQASLGLGLAF